MTFLLQRAYTTKTLKATPEQVQVDTGPQALMCNSHIQGSLDTKLFFVDWLATHTAELMGRGAWHLSLSDSESVTACPVPQFPWGWPWGWAVAADFCWNPRGEGHASTSLRSSASGHQVGRLKGNA